MADKHALLQAQLGQSLCGVASRRMDSGYWAMPRWEDYSSEIACNRNVTSAKSPTGLASERACDGGDKVDVKHRVGICCHWLLMKMENEKMECLVTVPTVQRFA